MRKYLFIAAVAALALTSCQREKDFNDKNLGKDGIAFVLQGNASTRSADAAPVTRGEILSVAKKGGVEIFLEETVTDLNAIGAATRGTPMYTENIGYLFRDQLSVRASTYTGDVTYKQIGETQDSDGYWCYGYNYPTNIWGDNQTEVEFHLRMPVDMTAGNAVSNLDYRTGAVTYFEYTSPATATDTKDIAFGGLTITGEEYQDAYSQYGGARVTLYHALTGVKFAVANDDDELGNLQIDEITFSGLANSGKCTFTPTATTKIAWTDVKPKGDAIISQQYDPSDSFISYDSNDNPNHFAESFFNGGANKNINDAKASKTFWFVPQDISDSEAELTIKYTFNGEQEEMTIVLGNLQNSNWLAGQLRTYTFKVNQVNLMIKDEVVLDGGADNGYQDSVKQNVTITNTGNTRAFIRAALVGQWLDENNDPVFGFTDEVNNLYIVESWYEDQFVYGEHEHGAFDGLAGYKGATLNTTGANPYKNWQLCPDGYYYYTLAVEPDEDTEELFHTYTVGKMPKATLGGIPLPNATVYFTLEIATQAIAANGLDGIAVNWYDAWKNALGKDPRVEE